MEFIAISPLDKARLIVAALYAMAILIVHRRLFPRLSPTSKVTAMFMLVSLLLMLVMALVVFPEQSNYDWRVWSLDYERTIPAALATTQLALVGFVALLTACFSYGRPLGHRLYWVGIALLFLLLAQEEYLQQRGVLVKSCWIYLYALVGVVVLRETAIVAASSSRRARSWHICLASGLIVGAAGAIGVEQLRIPNTCYSLGFLADVRCMLYIVEESMEFLGIWLVLLAVLGQFSLVAPSPSRGIRVSIFALPGLLFGALILTSPYFITLPTELEYRYRARRAVVELEADVELKAYRIETIERSMTVALFVSPEDWLTYSGLGYSIHLVDQVTGESVAGADELAQLQRSFMIGSRIVYFQRIHIEIPHGTVTNRALWVVLTAWREEMEEFVPRRIISSDLKLLDETQVILGELALPSKAADDSAEALAVFVNGFELGMINLPESANPDNSLEISMEWSATKDGADDYIQFLHFYHDESGEWWVFDQQPLGARLPTRLWRSGLADGELWTILLPANLAPGLYHVFTGLYRLSDLERMAVSDSDGALYADARVPVGSLTIERSYRAES